MPRVMFAFLSYSVSKVYFNVCSPSKAAFSPAQATMGFLLLFGTITVLANDEASPHFLCKVQPAF